MGKEIVHKLSWEPSSDPKVEGYRLYQNGELIDVLPVGSCGVRLYCRCPHERYVYSIVSFYANRVESELVLVILPK
ncbi:MAG: hypothetical protein JSR46_03190 [Verrucomicrobia bacterium]|nr:hypothetical protein [Verrucomicrobiota bacterium]